MSNVMTVKDAGDQLLDIDDLIAKTHIIIGHHPDTPERLVPFTQHNVEGGVCNCCSDRDYATEEYLVQSIFDVMTMECVFKTNPVGEEEEMLYGTGSKIPVGLLTKEKP